MRVKGESDRQRIARIVKRCFVSVNWTRQTFALDGKYMHCPSGETYFYEVREINKGLTRLNRLQRLLTASTAAPQE